MRLLSRSVLRELVVTALLWAVLFTFLIFLMRARPLFEFLVRNTGPHSTVIYMFLLVLPQSLPFTVPMGVLVAVLMTLTRMSTDGEITAMRAAGIPGRRVAPPILWFGAAAMLITAACSMWLTPWSIRERFRVENLVIGNGLSSDVQPRVFEERFPNSILYVTDVATGVSGRWKKIFLADITPPESRPPGSPERGDDPRITLASEAIVVADPASNRLQLALRNGSTYEAGKDTGDYRITAFPAGDQALDARKPDEVHATRPSVEMDMRPLYRLAYQDRALDRFQRLDARTELHQRLALPMACVLMALVGVPLGITRRRAGKSAAVVMTAGVAFVYFLGIIGFIGMARQEGLLGPEIAVWLPNLLFAVGGLTMLVRLEKPGDADLMGALSVRLRRLRRPVLRPTKRLESGGWLARFSLLPRVTDTYVLSSFMFYFGVLLASFVLMYQVFSFFELLSDIIRNRIP